ncbi:hypothetical protein C0993_006090, partial [Termitomyces sp. T159_Od127]
LLQWLPKLHSRGSSMTRASVKQVSLDPSEVKAPVSFTWPDASARSKSSIAA